MKIIELKVDGFRKLEAVELKFNQNGLTIIQGDNEAGKSSILDSIQYLFEGQKVINDKVIQNGKDKTEIELQTDKYTIKRVKTLKTDRLIVETKEKAVLKSPQSFLQEFVNELTFDPFPFLNKTADQKLKFLMDFLNIDFEGINNKINEIEIERRICGQQGKELGKPVKPDNIVTERVNIQELLERHNAINVFNSKQTEKLNKKKSLHLLVGINANKILELQKQIDKIKTENRELIIMADNIQVENFQDTESIEKEIKGAENQNRLYDEYQNYLNDVEAYEKKRNEYEKFTTEIEKLRNQKRKELENSKTGIKDLMIQENGLYYKGIDSENWSDSQGIDISCQLCIAMNPKLKAVFVDRGESFGNKKLKQIKEWAKKNDIQIVLTRIGETGDKQNNVFYIEEGKIL